MSEIYNQLNKFISQMPPVAKSGTNTFFKSAKNKDGSKYSTLEDCLAVLAGSESSKSIQDFGLFLDQRNEFVAEHKMPVLVTRVIHEGGSMTDPCVVPLLMGGSSSPMQQLGSADTYARRYSIIKIFRIADIDNDGNPIENKKFIGKTGNGNSSRQDSGQSSSSEGQSVSPDSDGSEGDEDTLDNGGNKMSLAEEIKQAKTYEGLEAIYDKRIKEITEKDVPLFTARKKEIENGK